MGSLASERLGLATVLPPVLPPLLLPSPAPLLVGALRPRLPVVMRQNWPGVDDERRYHCIFATNASEISKLAVTFWTSSLSSSWPISRRIFSPASSSTETVFCGRQTSDALRGSPNLASSAFCASVSD